MNNETDLALTVHEVAQRTRVGRGRVYEAVASGELRSIRIGRRVLVPVAAVREWLEHLSAPKAV